jgi:hypothetical protein
VTALLLVPLFVPVVLMLLMLGMQAVEVRLERAAARAAGEVPSAAGRSAGELRTTAGVPPPRDSSGSHGGIAAGVRAV